MLYKELCRIKRDFSPSIIYYISLNHSIAINVQINIKLIIIKYKKGIVNTIIKTNIAYIIKDIK